MTLPTGVLTAMSLLPPLALVKSTLAIVSIALLTILVVRVRQAPPAVAEPACVETLHASATSAQCPTPNACEQGFLNAQYQTCAYHARMDNVPCSNACYQGDAGHCSQGECTGNVEDCRGTCAIANDCGFMSDEDVWLQKFAWALNHDPTTNFPYRLLHQSSCFFGRCALFILDIFAASISDALGDHAYNVTLLAAHLQCADYLKPDVRAAHEACLTIERFMIDPNVTRPGTIAPELSNSSLPLQLSVCAFSWTCAETNEEMLGASRKRGLPPPIRSGAHDFASAALATIPYDAMVAIATRK